MTNNSQGSHQCGTDGLLPLTGEAGIMVAILVGLLTPISDPAAKLQNVQG